MRSRRVEERAADILAIWEARKDIALEELRLALAETGLVVFVAGLHRFFARRGMIAPMVLDGPTNGDWFEAYVVQVLVPELR
ncbi:MAG TPA: hypothetical protein PK823_19370 [Novosphingobium sp.]|nr:hypothetical protein [Novosphingobium sp.]